ncbi:hypothetical protein CTEN210_06642 [Chaetoceros tenuissimus]|uniref:Leucine-rich repeat domain-containing protein n=1 Tax=Chaetoceros tenuissimus TaxID=426638 RepID=A0AAD3CS25_9STRA|nr:hypothetical protein CTEN210_06642 [Chaetoceros tenuissimus]
MLIPRTEEWRRFVPGVRMYYGEYTLFYNGEILFDENEEYEFPIYDEIERDSWQVIIILPGVEVIPEFTFYYCTNVKEVIMADTVLRIEKDAFGNCENLYDVKLSRNLEYIGKGAFYGCYDLTSIFIPPSCREIGRWAFARCNELKIFNVPRHTQLGEGVIEKTALFWASSFETDDYGGYSNTEQVNQWIKNINNGEQYELHRACSSFTPSMDIIYGIVKRKGPSAFQKKNEVGLTALEYLYSNHFTELHIDQRALMKRYVLEMMGEAVFNVM